MIYGHGFRIFIMKFLGCASDGGKQAQGQGEMRGLVSACSASRARVTNSSVRHHEKSP